MPPDLRWNDFSLAQGGSLYHLGTSLGLPRDARGLVYLGFVIAAITWIPLLILSAVEGVLTRGPAIPFLASLGTHARFLLTIPLFFVTQVFFSRRSREAISALIDSKLIPDAE